MVIQLREEINRIELSDSKEENRIPHKNSLDQMAGTRHCTSNKDADAGDLSRPTPNNQCKIDDKRCAHKEIHGSMTPTKIDRNDASSVERSFGFETSLCAIDTKALSRQIKVLPPSPHENSTENSTEKSEEVEKESSFEKLHLPTSVGTKWDYSDAWSGNTC